MIFSKVFDGVDYSVQNSTKKVLNLIDLTNIIYDSRKVTNGCAFVCLSGSNTDGHKFAEQAVKCGASLIVSQKKLDIKNIPVLIVNDTRLTLALMSANYFSHPAKSLKTIGLTGTKGKTTTACMIKSIMENQGYKVGIIGTLGVIIGNKTYSTNNTTPESYEIQYYMKKMVDKGCDCAVIEVSSLGLKWNRVAGFNFDVGAFTNFAPDHIGENEHKDIEEYKYCKSLLFKRCKFAAANIDDEAYNDILKSHTCEISTFGFSEQASFKASNEQLTYRPGYLGVSFDLSGNLNLHVNVSIPGKFSVYNALASITVCSYFNVTEQAILNGLNNVMVKGRIEMLKTNGSYTLLIDYAHNALSMENILTTLREYNPNRLVCLFGAGGNRAKSRRYEMGETCGKLADLSIITADNSRFENVMDIIADIKTGISKTNGKNVVVPDRKEAIKFAIENAQEHDIIILAGKGHEDYQEINGVKHHFDEREIVNDILNKLEKK